MALFVRQSEERSKLQERLAAELQEKAKARAKENTQPDGVTDSIYLKNTKSTTNLAGVWITIVVLAIAAFVVVMVAGQ
jgi:hypothetical protein